MPPATSCRNAATSASRGFTLVEIIIGSSIGAFVLAGVMSSFLMLTRSGQRMYQYSGMVLEARRALEEFSQDARMASNIVLNSPGSLTLTVPDNYSANNNQVTYAFDSATTGDTARSYYRRPGNITSNATATILAHNVESCTYDRWDRLGNRTTTDTATKRVQVQVRLRSTASTTVATTENAISATYLLRNKTTN